VRGLCLLSAGVTATVIAGAALDWYPARIGGLSFWLDDHLYQPFLRQITNGSGRLALGGLLFLLALAVSAVGYLLAAHDLGRQRRGERRHLWLIAGVQLLLCGWLAVQPYVSSQDIFSYAFYAHIFTWYRDNPYLAVPRDYPYDPLFSAIFWKDQPSNYGPLWTYLSALAPLAVGLRVEPTLLILKAITTVAAASGTVLLWSTLGRLRPERRVAGTVLWAWNPLLLIETGEAGHNDIVMTALMIGSLWAWTRDRRLVAVGLLILAALVKYIALLLLPLYLVVWWRQGAESPWQIAGRVAAVGGGLSIAVLAPIYAGAATFQVIGFGTNPLAYTNSLLEPIFHEVRIAFGDPPAVADLPTHYDGHWVSTRGSTILWSEPNEERAVGILLPASTSLLVVEPEASSWIHVYEPRLAHFGFIHADDVRPAPAPATAVASGTTTAVLVGIRGDRAARLANIVVRALAAFVFFPCYAWVLYHLARDSGRRLALPRASATVLTFYLLVVQSWFWPWYLLWVLPYAAITWDRAVGQIALALTFTAGTLNAQPTVTPPPLVDLLYGGRALVVLGLPTAGVLIGRRWHYLLIWRRLSAVWAISRPYHRLAGIALVIAIILAAGTTAAIATSSATTTRDPEVTVGDRAFDAATRAYSAGDFETAVQQASIALRNRPGERSVLELRISANLALDRSAATIPDLTYLLAQDPNDVDLRLDRGIAYARIARFDRALADFARASAIAPDDPRSYEWMGLVHFEEGELEEARLQLQDALALAPQNGRIARELAAVLASQGNQKGALAAYDRAADLDSTDAQTYADRAAILRRVGAVRATVPDLRRVLTLSGDVQQLRWAERLLASASHQPSSSRSPAG